MIQPHDGPPLVAIVYFKTPRRRPHWGFLRQGQWGKAVYCRVFWPPFHVETFSCHLMEEPILTSFLRTLRICNRFGDKNPFLELTGS
jgi:hypothetical protein